MALFSCLIPHIMMFLAWPYIRVNLSCWYDDLHTLLFLKTAELSSVHAVSYNTQTPCKNFLLLLDRVSMSIRFQQCSPWMTLVVSHIFCLSMNDIHSNKPQVYPFENCSQFRERMLYYAGQLSTHTHTDVFIPFQMDGHVAIWFLGNGEEETSVYQVFPWPAESLKASRAAYSGYDAMLSSVRSQVRHLDPHKPVFPVAMQICGVVKGCLWWSCNWKTLWNYLWREGTFFPGLGLILPAIWPKLCKATSKTNSFLPSFLPNF